MEVGGEDESLEEELDSVTSYDLAHVVTFMSYFHINMDELLLGWENDPSLLPCGDGRG